MHTPREGNACAEYIANIGQDTKQSIFVLNRPPPWLLHLIEIDKSGVAHVALQVGVCDLFNTNKTFNKSCSFTFIYFIKDEALGQNE